MRELEGVQESLAAVVSLVDGLHQKLDTSAESIALLREEVRKMREALSQSEQRSLKTQKKIALAAKAMLDFDFEADDECQSGKISIFYFNAPRNLFYVAIRAIYIYNI